MRADAVVMALASNWRSSEVWPAHVVRRNAILLEGAIQRVEERHPLREEHVVVGMCELEALDDRANRRGFGCAKATVLQIEIVNNNSRPSFSFRSKVRRVWRNISWSIAPTG